MHVLNLPVPHWSYTVSGILPPQKPARASWSTWSFPLPDRPTASAYARFPKSVCLPRNTLSSQKASAPFQSDRKRHHSRSRYPDCQAVLKHWSIPATAYNAVPEYPRSLFYAGNCQSPSDPQPLPHHPYNLKTTDKSQKYSVLSAVLHSIRNNALAVFALLSGVPSLNWKAVYDKGCRCNVSPAPYVFLTVSSL